MCSKLSVSSCQFPIMSAGGSWFKKAFRLEVQSGSLDQSLSFLAKDNQVKTQSLKSTLGKEIKGQKKKEEEGKRMIKRIGVYVKKGNKWLIVRIVSV